MNPNGMREVGDEYWWATLDILAGRQEKKPRTDLVASVDEWLMKLTSKIAKQRKLALEAPKTTSDKGEEEAEKKQGKPVKAVEVKKVENPIEEYQYLQTSFGDHIEIELSLVTRSQVYKVVWNISSPMDLDSLMICPIRLDNFGGTYESWKYHVTYNVNDILRKESKYYFSNPRVRSRLEKLMGSNVVRITDRKYMIKLQERIKEDHLENQKKRIQEREAEEVEREKKLILEGKIPIEAAPKELKNHPVCKINQITKKILEDKKGKGKPSRLTSSKGQKKTKESPEIKLQTEENEDDIKEKKTPEVREDEEADDLVVKGEGKNSEVDEVNKVILKKEEYEKLKYEAPKVKLLKKVENVDEMYKLAEEIVGPLKHQKTSNRRLRQDPGAGGPQP